MNMNALLLLAFVHCWRSIMVKIVLFASAASSFVCCRDSDTGLFCEHHTNHVLLLSIF